MSLIDEIRQQPDVIRGLVRDGADDASALAGLVRSCSHVVIAARGTSDNAARYAQYVWGARNGVQVSLATPSLFSLYGRPPQLEGSLVIGISQSGQSPDIVSVVEEGRRQGRPTVAITNDPESPLALSADLVVPLRAGPEHAVAATKTYTAQLVVVAQVSEAILHRSLDETVADSVEAALGVDKEARSAASEMGGVAHAAVLGRGFNLATAYEWALKMQELSYVVAQPFSSADFLHGPVSVVDSGYPILGIAMQGPVLKDVVSALSRSSDRGAPTVVITNSDEVAHSADSALRTGSGIDEWLTPIPAIVVGQLFTYWLTTSSGHDPDAPRGLQKVTKTL